MPESERRSIFRLIGDLPGALMALVRAELDSLKSEIAGKLKAAGIGIGLLAGAALFAFFLVCVLIAAAILGLATALPGWAAALIVAGLLLIITVVLALLGIGSLKKGVPPAPTETVKSIQKDVNAIKGIGKKD
jgi:ABC-type transport system involved in multi-copper enzyme maturation permease subunit